MLISVLWIVSVLLAPIVLVSLLGYGLGVRYIPHNRVGIIEKLWAGKGSLSQGKIIALNGEAGFQAELLRGGLHFFYFPWQYRIHLVPLVLVAENKIGYVYGRDGQALSPAQTLAKVVPCTDFQDARAFLTHGGQRGRQRAILREGVYAINLAQFVVITEDYVLAGPIRDEGDRKYESWQLELRAAHGFNPVVIGAKRKAEASDSITDDSVGVVTIHDGPPLESGEIIAPEVRPNEGQRDHDYFQDPETFLRLGGRRGKQLQVLTDGTFFLNRWFATVEIHPKTMIPIGYVGVVVSYFGIKGKDLTGDIFRYGEQVEPGYRGVWKRPLSPGKYPLNPYAQTVELVPTINFVLRWITGTVEVHEYDKDLKSIDLITADGYEPTLPLSLILHIDYEKAPSVVQRFGDVKRLISQTLDPILSAYFRDVAQNTQMLDLLTKREEIQKRATDELGRRFKDYDINCISVLIGRPDSKSEPGSRGEEPIKDLFNQLRLRRLAREQLETYEKQEEAAHKLKALNAAQAEANKMTELTQTKIDIDISANRGEASLAEARRLAERDVVRADGEGRARELQARGESHAQELIGKGEASKVAQVGLAEAAVFLKKVQAYGDPRLFALQGVTKQLSVSQQPLVPQQVWNMTQGESEQSPHLFSQLFTLLLAEKGQSFNLSSEGLQQLEQVAQTYSKSDTES
ncbi:MAG: hypothetical protein KDC71_04995 [Acidobacteria bacterium]|nr:hypothetical protein [Acidobacteriota bacterium]